MKPTKEDLETWHDCVYKGTPDYKKACSMCIYRFTCRHIIFDKEDLENLLKESEQKTCNRCGTTENVQCYGKDDEEEWINYFCDKCAKEIHLLPKGFVNQKKDRKAGASRSNKHTEVI